MQIAVIGALLCGSAAAVAGSVEGSPGVACPLPYSEWRRLNQPVPEAEALFDDESADDADTLAARAQLYEERCAVLDAWNRAHAGVDRAFTLGPSPRFIDRLPSELAHLRPSTRIDDQTTAQRDDGLATPGDGAPGATPGATPSNGTDDGVGPVDGWSYVDWRDPANNPAACVAVTGIKDQVTPPVEHATLRGYSQRWC
jgi:hypothetical protein